MDTDIGTGLMGGETNEDRSLRLAADAVMAGDVEEAARQLQSDLPSPRAAALVNGDPDAMREVGGAF